MCQALDRCFTDYGIHYSTVRQVVIQDVRVTCTYYLLLLGVLVFGTYNIISNDLWCEIVEIDEPHYVSEFFWRSLAWQEQYNRHKDHPEEDPPYCTGEINTDFWFAPHRRYFNNPCIWWYERGDITGKMSGTQLRATTSYGMWKNSSVDHAQITPWVEKFNLIMHFTIHIRDIEEVPETWMYVNGTWKKLFDTDPPGQTSFIQMYIEDLLAVAEIDLDDRNEGNNGTDGLINAPYPENQQWPTYRLTGVELRLMFDVSNFKHRNHPFDRTVRNRISIEADTLDTSTTWVCSGFRYLKNESGDMMNAHSCDVRATIVVGGEMCFFSGNALLSELVNLTVMFGVVFVIIDLVFGTLLRSFYKARFILDDVDMRLRRNVGEEIPEVIDHGITSPLIP